MPLWTTSVKPKWLSNTEQKEVIATNTGWELRHTYTDTHGNTKTRRETLVALPRLASKGTAKGVLLYVANTTGGTTLKTGLKNYIYLVYNEPLTMTSNYGNLRMVVANTAGGNNMFAAANMQSASVLNDNTLVFLFKPSVKGTYKVNTQTISNSATWATLTGNVTATTGSNNLSWSTVTPQTLYTTQVKVGDILRVSGDSANLRVVSISNSTLLVTNPRVAGNQTNKAFSVKRVATITSSASGESANLAISDTTSNTEGVFTVA